MIAAIMQHPKHGTLKVYDHRDDWQIIGAGFERWFSQWQADRLGSLQRAADAIGATLEPICQA